MKTTLKNIDIKKVIKIIVLGTLVIVVLIGSTLILKDTSIIASIGDGAAESAKFYLQDNKEIIKEGAQFILK